MLDGRVILEWIFNIYIYISGSEKGLLVPRHTKVLQAAMGSTKSNPSHLIWLPAHELCNITPHITWEPRYVDSIGWHHSNMPTWRCSKRGFITVAWAIAYEVLCKVRCLLLLIKARWAAVMNDTMLAKICVVLIRGQLISSWFIRGFLSGVNHISHQITPSEGRRLTRDLIAN